MIELRNKHHARLTLWGRFDSCPRHFVIAINVNTLTCSLNNDNKKHKAAVVDRI